MRPDVSIVTSGHDVADARLHRQVAALRREGITIEILGLGDASQAPGGVTLRTWERGSMLSRAWRAMTFPWRARGRVIITLDPDLAPMMAIVRRIKRKRIWVADVHEDYVALLQDRTWATAGIGIITKLTQKSVAAAAKADLTLVADDHVPPYAIDCNARLMVRNIPEPVAEQGVFLANQQLRAVYVGDVRESRGLRVMVDALGQAPGWKLDIVGPVAATDADWLQVRLLADDVSDRVTLHGRLPLDQAWQVAAGASVGMLLLDDTPAFRASIPTKLHEYMSHAMAVLATDLPRVSAIIRESHAGATVSDTAAAAAQLQAWRLDPQALLTARQAAQRWAKIQSAASPWREFARAIKTLVRGDVLELPTHPELVGNAHREDR